MSEPLHIISLGAGVQSSTMALMAAKGELTPMPTCAIFADTKCEPLEVYRWLDWLEKQLPFPVHRVAEKRGLLNNIVRSLGQRRIASVPFFTESKRGGGKLRRQCTKEFKIVPITRKVRELVGLKPGKPGPRKATLAVQWIGISLDEVTRMKPSRIKWIEHIWPLVDRRMKRQDCLRWMEKNGYPMPPRSACTFCPYHSSTEWARLKADSYAWRQIVAVDSLIRNGVRGTKEKLFLHPSMKPITEVDFSTEEERGQLNMFENECEGMCGV
jgi:hypothetical protein